DSAAGSPEHTRFVVAPALLTSDPANKEARGRQTGWEASAAAVPRTADGSSGSASSAVASAKEDRRRYRPARRLRVPFAVGAVALAVFAARLIEQRLSVRTALAEGEEAFRRGDFTRAADRFHTALETGPASTAVRLRLVAAYQNQYVPGGESLANVGVATHALEEI